MKTMNAVIAGTLILLLVAGCQLSEPDTEQPSIALTNPPDSAVLGSNVTVRAAATDNEQITRVEFYINGHMDSNDVVTRPPYEYKWAVSNDSLYLSDSSALQLSAGAQYELFAIARDGAENVMISNFVPVYYQWVPLLNDVDESYRTDIEQVFIRSTKDYLEFYIKAFDSWVGAHDSGYVNYGIFLDTDGDSLTGLRPDSGNVPTQTGFLTEDSASYWVNDIGADYAIILGFEGDHIYSWDMTTYRWIDPQSIDSLRLEDDASDLYCQIDLSKIGNPMKVRVVCASIKYRVTKTKNWDWDPDTGHQLYLVNGLYIDESSD